MVSAAGFSSPAQDPLLPSLWSISKALEGLKSGNASAAANLDQVLLDCIAAFKKNDRYRDDPRFLKVWFLYMDRSKDFENVFREMEENRICIGQSVLYEFYAWFLEAKGNLLDAFRVYQTGIDRNAEPLGRLKKSKSLFLDRISDIIHASSLEKTDVDDSTSFGESCIDPWSISTLNYLLNRIKPDIVKYDGFRQSSKPYPGKVPLTSLKNKTVEIGGVKYQIKGSAGQGGFAQVFRAFVNGNFDEVVAIKIQKPAFPWEFYMYRQLDKRIPEKERSSFGFAQRLQLYSDCSVLVCDYLAYGTLQDAVNSYWICGKSMDELLCMYYTIEMLYMLERLHSVGIIHGDFKPDNLLMRYARDDLMEDQFHERGGSWRDQGLCLVDWGRGMDLHLFPDNTTFKGDCRTSGFRCVEMQQKRPWKFQVDTYGLCVVVHLMLHNTYMEIEKKAHNGGFIYLPKLPFKRYWNGLWKELFTVLLNIDTDNCYSTKLLQKLRESFQNYLCSKPHFVRELKQLLLKQRASLPRQSA